MFNIVVLISGSGSNLQAIIGACDLNIIKGKVVAVISNESEAYGLERAKKHNIPYKFINHNEFNSREEFDEELVEAINGFNPDLIVLAGFMRILSKVATSIYKDKMINIHPSLLPKYPGLNTHEKVLANKDSIHGVTIHKVSAELDAGPIIAQAKIAVKENEPLEELIERIHKAEHKLFPKIISLIEANEINLKDFGLNQNIIDENYDF